MSFSVEPSAYAALDKLASNKQKVSNEGYNALSGFIASILSSAGPEFVGLSNDKSPSLLRWEGQYPIANVISDILGFGGSYAALTAATGGMGGIGALGRIPRVAKIAQRGLQTLRGSGQVGGQLLEAGAKEMLRFAPVEAARLGIAAGVGDPSVVASHLPINMLAIGGIGAGIKGVKMMLPLSGPILRSEGLIADVHPEFRAFQKPQQRLQQLIELQQRDIAEGSMFPELEAAYRAAIDGAPATSGTWLPGLKQVINKEEPLAGVRAAVRRTTTGGDIHKKLNELFRLTPFSGQKYFTSRFLSHGKNGVSNTPQGRQLLDDVIAQLPENYQAHMQFGRLIDTTKVSGGKGRWATSDATKRWKKIEDLFQDAEHIGSSSFFKELESGMFVVLKRTGDHQGVLFKTDNLGFFEKAAKEAPAIMSPELWAIGPEYAISSVLKDLGPMAQDIRDMLKAYPRYLDITGRTPGETLEKIASVLNPETRRQTKRVTRFFRENFKKAFAPWLHVTSSSPQAVRLSSMARQLSSQFHAEATREFGGKVTSEILEAQGKLGKGAPIRGIVGKLIPTKGGIHQKIESLTSDDLSSFREIIAKAIAGDELSIKKYSKQLISYVKAQQKLDDKTTKRIMAVMNWTDSSDMTPLARHMMMSRMWTGPWRVRIVDKDGYILGYGSGHTKPEAIADANAITEFANNLLTETGSIVERKVASPVNLERMHRSLKTSSDYQPRGKKDWEYHDFAGVGEEIYTMQNGKGQILVRRAEGTRTGVVFEAIVEDGPPTLGLYSSPKEAAEAIEKQLRGRSVQGPIRAETWDVFARSHEEDLMKGLEPDRWLSLNQDAISAVDRAFVEVYEKLPARMKHRTGAIGYAHYHKPLTKNEINDLVLGNLITSYRYMSHKIRDKLFEPEMAYLDMTNPAMAKEIKKRFARLDGVSGPITKQINKATDALFAPLIGPESATKISGALTNVMFRLTLTSGDVGFPAVNALTFLQTVYPEVTLLRDLPPEALQHFYSTSLVATKAGWKTIHHLSPRKITNEGWRQLFSSSTGKDKILREAIQKASDQGVVSPRFVEEYLGKMREDLTLTKANIGESWFDFIKAADSWMAGKSEQLSRLHAFLTGRIVGKVIFPELGEDALYNFAREFTERTMFLYNQAGRATAFTGPIGSAVGLFKNWPLHYLGNLAGYMGAGFRYGHWKPLAWSMLGTGTVAGFGGIPFYAVADGASRVLSDKPLMHNLYDWMGYADAEPIEQKAIDAFYYGIPALGGITFQGRAEAPSSDLVRDINQMYSVMMMDRFGAAYKAAGEAIDTWDVTGQHPFRNPKVRDMMARAFLPRTVYRAMQRTAQGAIKSLTTGSPLISDISLPQHIKYTFGLTPIKVQQDRDIDNYYYESEKKLQARISQMGQLLSSAFQERDFKRYNELLFQALFRDDLPIDKVLRSEATYNQHREREDAASALSFMSRWEKRRLLGR